MKIQTIVPILLLALSGCEARGPAVKSLHATGAGDLERIAPECRNPSSARYMACVKAAEMLEAKDPRAATDLYLTNWNQVAFEGRRQTPAVNPAIVFLPIEVAVDGINSGSKDAAALAGAGLAVIAVAAVAKAAIDDAHEQRVDAAARITTRTLRKIYLRSGDAYSQTMLIALPRAVFRDSASWDWYARGHEEIREAFESGTLLPPPPAQEYRPVGKGPVPYQTPGGWKVVEAGKTVDVHTTGGERHKGVVSACSTRGVLIREGADEVFVDADDLAEIR